MGGHICYGVGGWVHAMGWVGVGGCYGVGRGGYICYGVGRGGCIYYGVGGYEAAFQIFQIDFFPL